jgi:hypothetical protein
MESGFCTFRNSDGRRVYAALWSDCDKAEKNDRPLGSRRAGREGEGTARVGYETLAWIRERDGAEVAHSGQPIERVELRPLAGLEFEGEPVSADCAAGHFIGVEPIAESLRGRFYCGGDVLATIWLAGFDWQGLPCARVAYISREKHSATPGRLSVAIPA